MGGGIGQQQGCDVKRSGTIRKEEVTAESCEKLGHRDNTLRPVQSLTDKEGEG